MRRNGFSILGIVIALGVLAIIAGGVYWRSSGSGSSAIEASLSAEEQAKNLKTQIETQARSEEHQIESLNQTATKNMSHIITLNTDFGTIEFATYDADAPKAVNNFITLANKGFYNKLAFHRVIKGFMIQGGDPKGDGTGGPGYKFEDELNPTTASYRAGYQKGVVAMANAGPNTNGSQFFIMLENYPLPNNYTIFGRVVKGQDVVDAIGAVKTGANDRPLSPVIIENATVRTAP